MRRALSLSHTCKYESPFARERSFTINGLSRQCLDCGMIISRIPHIQQAKICKDGNNMLLSCDRSTNESRIYPDSIPRHYLK